MTSKWITATAPVTYNWEIKPTPPGVKAELEVESALEFLLEWVDCYDNMANRQDDFEHPLEIEERLASAARVVSRRRACEGLT